jgi:hypothetical protein
METRQFQDHGTGITGLTRAPQVTDSIVDGQGVGGLHRSGRMVSVNDNFNSRKLLATSVCKNSCPAGSLGFLPVAQRRESQELRQTDVDPSCDCEKCPFGRYQPLKGSFACSSCPHGFSNNISGSRSLSECCQQQRDVGLYNDHVQTSYNIFGESLP